MTKKSFLSIAMVFLGLLAGTNTAWATDPNPETDYYWAKLTARPSTGTGGSGKVYVSNTRTTPADGDYQNESSAYSSKDSYVQIAGNVVDFYTYAKADDGSYFVGWSDFNGGREKAQTKSYNCGYEPSAKRGISNALEYAIYATFEPIRIVSYRITGEGTTVSGSCSFTVYFQPDATISLDDFEEPEVTYEPDKGEWKVLTEGRNKLAVAASGELKVPVNLTGAETVGSYLATLTVTTKAGISIDVPLYARTITAAPDNAVLYDGKTQMATGTVAKMLAVNTSSYANPIIKLSGDYSDAVSINKNITFDLNGYTLSNTLTVSGGDVTLAYSPFGGAISSNVSVTGGKLILTGGTITGNVNVSAGATLEQNGAAITGDVTNAGTLATTDGSITGQLTSSGALTLNGGTFTNNSGAAIAITGGTAQIKRGTIRGSTYGVQTSGGTTTIEKLAVITGDTKALYGNGGTLTVNNGKFTDPANFIAGTVTFKAGYFQTHSAGTATALGKQVWRNRAGVEYREGYEFFVGDQAAAQASNVSVCRINTTAYPSLEDALAYANNNPSKSVTIFMENDYTLPAGYYTLPANATLVVPMSDDQNIAYPYITHHRSESAYPTSYVFRTLTFASGVNMSVLGTIELSGEQFSKGGDPEQSIPGGPYGRLILKPGSHVTLNDGGELRAWGYVTGDGTRAADGTYLSGEIDARRGAIVREQFQIGDWKGGDVSFTMIQDKQQKTHLFPIYEYFIQNVESPVKYHPGSALYCSTAVDAQVLAYANNIKVVGKEGETAMFLMDEMADAENTWVRKWYDANKDQQVYEINSGAQLGSMVINLGEVPKALIDLGKPGNYNIVMDSRKYILPLTSNMKIHLLSGNMQFTQSTSCLPGMEVEIDKESTITIINQGQDDVVEGALYLYDADQWGRYVMNGKYGSIVHYSATLGRAPNVRDVSSAAALGDAILNVHGTFQVGDQCAVYTTVGKTESPSGTFTQDISSGGASIISNNADAGTFIFLSDAPVASGVSIQDFKQGELNPEILVNYDNSENGLVISPTARGNSAHIYGFELCTSALLTNGDGSKTETAGTSANKSYCYIDGAWTDMKVDEDAECFMVDGHNTYYAKPRDYVKLANGKTPNADHTYSSADGTRLFILIKQDCQWWEVEKKDNLYHCIHPNNDTYYYWDDSNANSAKHKWVEKRFTITWKNWNGDIIQTTDENGDPVDEYSVTYGTMAEFLGTNPTREPNIDYTYDFTGWSPALGPVTSDVTYTATYEQKERKYTIVFRNEGGMEIERQFLTHNEMPVCENVPTRTGFTLEWSPAIKAVTGDATYTATWLEEPPTEYAVTFFDYDGVTKLKPTDATPYMVTVGSMPDAPTAPANKPATNEFTYVFHHWSPALEEVSATSAKSYVAVYNEVAKSYTIKYYKEDGSTLISTESLSYGATPTPPVVSKENPAANTTYTLVWKTLDEASGIQTVMGPAEYKPTYIAEENRYTRYTVTLSANIPAGVTLIGAGTYDKGEPVTIQAIPAEGYEFVQWNDGETNPERVISSITKDHTLSAEVRATAVAEDLEITATGSVTLNAPATKHDLVITSNGVTSGELIGANYLTLTGDAYFELKPNEGFDALRWYAVAVPWQVSIADGIFAGETPLHLGSGFQMVYYNSEYRAANGRNDETYDSWIFMSNSDNMQPGKLYMMYVNAPATTIRFKKVATAPIQTTVLSVKAYPQTTGHEADAGWNGIANPALYHAYLNASATTYGNTNFGQKYIPLDRRYDPVDMSSNNLIVGEPIFVQVASDKPNVVACTTWSEAAAPAPRRRAPRVDNAYYEVQISAGEAYTDRLYLQTLEDKEDRYVIGLDLAKAGVSNRVAQMWVNRYNAQLCVNTTAPVGKTATYPLGISVPENGTYQISSATEMQANQELYVTRNGSAIWNLAYGPYTVTLDKGTYSEYGIKLIQSNAPAVTTGVDQTTTDKLQIQKVLIDNKVYIVRDGALYTITGQKIN